MHYKFIDLPNIDLIAERILRNIPKEYMKNNMSKSIPFEIIKECTPLVEAVETMKPWSDLAQISLVITMPNEKFPIHTDLGVALKTIYALNIPIYNCKKSYTVFYRIKDNVVGLEKPQNHVMGDNYIEYNEEDVEEIGRMHLYKSAFFNTQIPHSTVNPTDDLRISITIRSKTPFI